ncbi:SDR family oxidoreductase [Streptomyces guryensis]|uniref:SDR family oxidoreductase n=1 Tax=Streptomyces guryensis TaxID=2886947 RepID=A0A9Q3ZA36_9ACTN|nr:SDR family oxidoreductase [Streptomyces guryensis]MCD9878939.1 SDR family oxidoreductase [Streptomyces guryensis]
MEGTHVVVIGGTSGIGLAIARGALREGAQVTIGARGAVRLSKTAAELGPAASTGILDVTDESSVRNFFENKEGIDYLALCPGTQPMGSIYDIKADDVLRCLSTKLVGQLLCVRHAAPRMNRHGAIVLLAGSSGFRPVMGMSVSGAANAGVAAAGRTLALELAPIRVNVLVPGMIATPGSFHVPHHGRSALHDSAACLTPLGRIGSPEDVATEVLHLFRSPYTTGLVHFVDGGALL